MREERIIWRIPILLIMILLWDYHYNIRAWYLEYLNNHITCVCLCVSAVSSHEKPIFSVIACYTVSSYPIVWQWSVWFSERRVNENRHGLWEEDVTCTYQHILGK